jgi:gas vesicle protein
MGFQKILIGTLAGFAVGVVYGILTAPDKGTETRQRIAGIPDDVKRRVRRFKSSGMHELDELSTIFKDEMHGLQDDVRARVLSLIEAARSGASNVKDQISAN